MAAAFQFNAFQLYAFQIVNPVVPTDFLQAIKDSLRVVHSSDDTFLTRLIASAVREYLAFINYDLPTEISSESSSEESLAISEDAFQGIVLMVQSDYEGDPEKRGVIRRIAETLWMPYRTGLGV